ncbi:MULTISPECIES: DUF3159 domain-containing protein [unclassified Fusibacter]|uniref:DUF3159 domain-containing protein n=1 Tax=unclassified Fusibacter TaxID=2624464 RepID=UPI001013082A|nr:MULTISPECIES: DUF3159 domain-containing protein [unclassified Fusibacter]MCK8058987.1 DUF3159 domain-containing protein [Fusibacter sp. A2]NPE22398.1 DUF3159 domain-containing protein [Fusibacter sp. A1]RXV60505.1 DUF3159 domain-containing protein [Fusibacter sp. A1]
MNKLITELKEEILSIVTGNTLDAMLPPLVFVIVNRLATLNMALITGLLFAVLLGIVRLMKKQDWRYAFGGMIGLLFTSVLVYATQSAANYFIPKLLSSGFGFLLTIISLIIGKPIAAFVSHLTRGWRLEWFWRDDIKPAYREVSVLWGLYFMIRLMILSTLYIKGDIWGLFWMNTLLGGPAILTVLIISYIYGIWRLKTLEGPGIDEFNEGVDPPWRGQTRGF